MNIYDLLNINNVDIVESIKEVVEETREQLKGLDTDLTCKLYSSAVFDNLGKRHILNRMIETSDLNCIYNHRFNMVLSEDNYYIIDLTYEQFKSDELPELKKNGYMLMNDEDFKHYLEIVGYSSIDISLEDAFLKKTRKMK